MRRAHSEWTESVGVVIHNGDFIHRLGDRTLFRLVSSHVVDSVDLVLEELVASAVRSRGIGSVDAWARLENAACALKLAAMADALDRRLAADGSADREQWCLDNWDAVAAEIAAAQNVSNGVASHQLLIAKDLRERLPRLFAVFTSGRSRTAWYRQRLRVPDRSLTAR